MSAQNRILYYNAQNRSGVTQRIESDGRLTTLQEFPPGTFGSWTHIVSDGQHLLYYNAQDRSGVTQRIESDGRLTTLQEFAPGTFGPWTHIVG